MPPKTRKTAQPPTTSPDAPAYKVHRGRPLPLGATLRRSGINFSIFSKHATSCTLVLLRAGADEPFLELPFDPHFNRTGHVWHLFVEGLDAGVQYGYRLDMQPNPDPTDIPFRPDQGAAGSLCARAVPWRGMGLATGTASGPIVTGWWWTTTSIGNTISPSMCRWSTALSTKCTYALYPAYFFRRTAPRNICRADRKDSLSAAARGHSG